LILPFFMRLSDLNEWLRDHFSEVRPNDDLIEAALVALTCRGHSEASRRFVREKLQTGHCVVLLDAWDEVPVEAPQEGKQICYAVGHRQWLGQQLAAFARQFPEPRLLITSRIVGYIESPLTDAKELELLAFDTRSIEAFARVWFSDKEAEDNTTMAQQFLALVREHPRMHGL